ncbi:MAG TPA: hypothetical protein VF297_16990 [Pyrinomonadaceae bacterium]
MTMRVVVPIITALVLIVVGVFWMFMMLVGANGYNTSQGRTILVGNLVLVIITIVIASVASGLLAHVLQKRTGMSPWLAGPLTIVSATVVSIMVLFFIGGVLIISIVDSTRKRPPQQPPAVNRRGG